MVYMIKALVPTKITDDKPVQYLSGWPFSKSKYCKQLEACVLDEATFNK